MNKKNIVSMSESLSKWFFFFPFFLLNESFLLFLSIKLHSCITKKISVCLYVFSSKFIITVIWRCYKMMLLASKKLWSFLSSWTSVKINLVFMLNDICWWNHQWKCCCIVENIFHSEPYVYIYVSVDDDALFLELFIEKKIN